MYAVTKSLTQWAGVLLLAGGLVHLLPPLYRNLQSLVGGGVPWIQICIGAFSILVAVVLLTGDTHGSSVPV